MNSNLKNSRQRSASNLFWSIGALLLLTLPLYLRAWSTYPKAVLDREVEVSAPIRQERDSVVRFPITKTYPRSHDDVQQKHPMDLRTPSNIRTEFVYDAASGKYLLITTLDGKRIGTPTAYTLSQYTAIRAARETADYFGQKIREDATAESKSGFNPFDFGFELGPAEKIFGPGGVKVRTQGSAEISLGVRSNATDNPSLPIHSRRHTFFDFNEKIQAGIQASVGSKLNFNLNYNTEANFDFDSKKLKLAYEGEEDDIIKVFEAGNVSLRPRNSLIQGGASLFGIHSRMQFGKLDVDMVVSQQEAETKRVSTDRGAQTTAFEFSANAYDENKHFFLGHYFRDGYDKAMSTLPLVGSGVKINRVEVWVTNKRGRFDEARNILAFTDLGEPRKVTAPGVVVTEGGLPANKANSLYSTLLGIGGLRSIDRVSQLLTGTYTGGEDYEKIESARRLSTSEYSVNELLGYISLNIRLQPDEVLGVAYEYTYGGQVYQVGEFSTDRPDNSTDNLFVKLLKGTSLTPSAPYWLFMMRNIYSLGSNVMDLQSDRFRLDIYYRNDGQGTALPYIDEGPIKGQPLIRVLETDHLDKRNEPYPDGLFDFVPDYTVSTRKGLVIFSTVEPFGATLANKLGDKALIEKYCYREIYDTTLVAAKQVAEKDKFILRGEFKAASGGQISLGAMNVTPGSVVVTAGGVQLIENVDYTVNYAMGTVTILNESVLNSGTRVDVSLENKGFFNLQRKTVFGVDLNYHFSPLVSLGATFMHLSEMPLTTKTRMGDESMRNTLWGVNFSARKESQWLTNVLDYIPLLNLTKPSEVTINAEFAHLIPGHYEGQYTKGHSYIDDFETSQGSIDLLNPYAWSLSSVPQHSGANDPFPEAKLVNDIRYGNHRARLAWFYIDPMFNRENSSLTPSYIRNNPELLSNHYVREIKMHELFPYRDQAFGMQSYLQTLNLSFYPQEPGPYNLNTQDLNTEGLFTNPQKMWGGITRKIDQSDFEASNIEYVEFWMLDPFIYNTDPNAGGDLFLNLGEVSEEVLKDEKKFFENGLPINDDPSATETTIWGKVPVRQASGYAFDNSPGAREKQDVGFNGLSTEEEKTFPTYATYLSDLQRIVGEQTLGRWREDPMSRINDPAGDNFKHFRDQSFDDAKAPVLERYKYFNGVDGNSAEAKDQTGSYSIASRLIPDVEDINQDNTLNENERYFEYHVSLRPKDLQVGNNFIVDERNVTVSLPNGETSSVKWYQFKIPVRNFTGKEGGITDFKTIRFVRLYLTGFSHEVFMRLGTFKLVRGEWRQYDRELHAPNVNPVSNATLEVSTVNIEENGDRKPVNYVLPPGVLRSISPDQAQATKQNEQSLSLKVKRLSPGDARAVYKNSGLDLRRYRRLELFTHAEQLPDDDTGLSSGELSAFIRLGSDYRNNYYEYSVPLDLTPHGVYGDSGTDRALVWPENNKIDFSFEQLTSLKMRRNRVQAQGTADYYTPYSVPDEKNARNTITVMGNPSLSNVKTILIGVRNGSGQIKSVEVWVNELRLSEYQEQGGYAANADVQLKLSDIGSLNARGTVQSAGFGALDQSLSQRRLEDLRQMNLSSNFELGRFFPEKAKVRIPFYYTYQHEMVSPQYNPFDQDILLSESLKNAPTKELRDSIRERTVTQTTAHSFSLSNMGVDIKSKTPMPYDPANFTFSYSYNTNERTTPEIEYDRHINWQGAFNYDYAPVVPPLRPFSFIKRDSKTPQSIASSLSALQNYQINYLPSRINFSTNIIRDYSEQQIRNFIPGVGDLDKLPVSFVQNFVWNRKLSVNWNPTTHLKLNFNSGTNARIEEPHVQVNRQLEPDQYQIWKDSVNRSLAELGSPIHYDQNLNATYTLPFALIPYLDFLTGSATYNATYNWDRGAQLVQKVSLGNTISNQMRLEGRVSMNLLNFYRKFSFYQEYEKRKNKSSSRASGANSLRNRDRKDSFDQEIPDGAKPKQAPNKYSKQVRLKADTTVLVEHNLNSKTLTVTARTIEGKNYPVSVQIIDANSFRINNKDTININLNVVAQRPKEPSPFVMNLLDGGIKLITMLRDVSISYTRSSGLHLPGFLPTIGAAGGQQNHRGVLAPGLKFAFGLTDNNFVTEAAERGWLIDREDNINPSMFTRGEDANVRVNLEPLPDLSLSLTFDYHDAKREETQYMFKGMPRTYGGTFNASTIALKGLFSSVKAADGYYSKVFAEFLNNRTVIADRLRTLYGGISGVGGLVVRENSADVLIPAFLAAYGGRSAQRQSLSPFTSLWQVLPNWNITYTGLSRVEALQDVFRNFSLSHNYRSTYTVGNYTSFLGWNRLNEKQVSDHPLGYITSQQDALSVGKMVASMPYDIPSVSIREGFSPLLGVEVTLKNGLGINSRWNKSRDLTLNLTSYQLMESSNNEISLGFSYKIDDFSSLLGLKKKPKGRSSKKQQEALLQSGGSMTLRCDYSYSRTSMLIRKIQDNFTQATNGNVAHILKFYADYALSRMITLRGYFDWNMNSPLVSTASFPVNNTSFGISLKFNLTQ